MKKIYLLRNNLKVIADLKIFKSIVNEEKIYNVEYRNIFTDEIELQTDVFHNYNKKSFIDLKEFILTSARDLNKLSDIQLKDKFINKKIYFLDEKSNKVVKANNIYYRYKDLEFIFVIKIRDKFIQLSSKDRILIEN